jgi:enoyl-CoA hydratase
MFSGGYDLKVMRDINSANMALLEKGSRPARRMLSFHYPVLAACNVHGVTKDVFLLLAADHRIAVDGVFRIGLNEVAIGMTMHFGGVELANGRLAPVFLTVQ